MLRRVLLARSRILQLAALVLAVQLGHADPVRAQAASAAISGTIADAQGGVLPGVTVTVTNAESGTVRTSVSEADGKYRVPGLNPGRYNITAELTGFQTTAVKDVTLQLREGETVGIVGESGSGKTMTGRSVLRLIRPPGEVKARKIDFDGVDLQALDEVAMREIRGRRIAMVMQDPKFSLNPVMTVGRQIAEAYLVHHKVGAAQARERTLEMLAAVKIRDPERVYGLYPHEVSGGMGQRIMMAMMLIPDPDLLIADEPTSALDVTVSMQVLAILDDLVTQRGMGLMFISHDLNLVATFCDRVLIMYAGRIVEECKASELRDAKHPYTQGLLASLPRIGEGPPARGPRTGPCPPERRRTRRRDARARGRRG